MSDLNKIDMIKLEKLFDMQSGCVLNFSNKTFSDFFLDELKLDIDDHKYYVNGSSKANRLRTFWRLESNYKVSKCILCMIDYYKAIFADNEEELVVNENLIQECINISHRIQSDNTTEQVIELDKIDINDVDMDLLLDSIRDSIEKDEPVLALDRLHTYCVKYIRFLCDKHGVNYDNNKPLHSCYGEYIKKLEKKNLIETEMTRTILRYSRSIFDNYNYVRNNKSFAHDNDILNYEESMLIYRTVSSILAFIRSVEIKLDELDKKPKDNIEIYDDDLPF